MANNKDKNSWLPKTESSVFKDLWAESLKKSVKETHSHDGKTCDEAHPDMSHKEWEETHDDHEGCSTCGESTITEAQLTEALMVLNEDKKEAWVPDALRPENLHWEWLRKLMGQSEETPPPTLGSPMKPLHKYKV